MLLYGASGHCKVIIDCLLDNKIEVSAIFDDNSDIKTLINYQVKGRYNPDLNPEEELIISIGNNGIRKKVAAKIKHKFGKVIHSSSIVSHTAKIDSGTVIFHGSIIQSSAIAGRHVIINTAASIDHDCRLEDFVHISPNATISGEVYVGEGTHIGSGAVVIQGIKIGKWCTVGAGAVIIRDVPDYAVVVGNPGRVIKYNNI